MKSNTVKRNSINIIGLKELREQTEKYIRGVELGQAFVVVRRSRPIFRITPLYNQNEKISVHAGDFKAAKKLSYNAKSLEGKIKKDYLLELSKSSFDFWNNSEDEIYDTL